MATPGTGPGGSAESASAAGRRPTLETVAARAGVSKSLVSLVLRNSPKVSPASRAAVMAAVDELGYRPNAAARLLAERRSRTVGVLLNDLRQPWFADLLDGLTPVLHAGGKHILLGDGRIDQAMDETLSWSFLDLGVDGLVLAGSVLVSPAVTSVASRIPTVAVGGLDPGLPRVDVLANDNHLGGTLAVRHLTRPRPPPHRAHQRPARRRGPAAPARLRGRHARRGPGRRCRRRGHDRGRRLPRRGPAAEPGRAGRRPSSRPTTCPAPGRCPPPRRWASGCRRSCRWWGSTTRPWPGCARCG